MNAAGYLIAIGLPFALGLLAQAAVSGISGSKPGNRAERLGASFPLGMGLVTMQMFLLGAFRLPLELFFVGGLLILEIALLALWVRLRRIPLWDKHTSHICDEVFWGHPLGRVIVAVLLAWVIVKLGSIFYMSSLRPLFAWDAWANWGARARVIYEFKGLMLDPSEFAGHFFGRGVVVQIVTYPLHLPLAEVWMALWSGGFDETASKMISPAVLSGISLHMYGALSWRLGRAGALLCVLLLLSSPLLSYHGTEGYADIWLAGAVYFACAAFVRLMDGDDRAGLVAGFWAGMAMWAKTEGIFFAFALLIGAGLWAVGERPRREALKTLAIMAFISVLWIAPWHVFRLINDIGFGHETVRASFSVGADVVHKTSSELYYRAFHPDPLFWLGAGIAGLKSFGPVFVFLPVLAFAGGRPGRRQGLLLLVLGAYLACFLVLYACFGNWSEHPDTFTNRNLLTLYPASCLALALLAGQRFYTASRHAGNQQQGMGNER